MGKPKSYKWGYGDRLNQQINQSINEQQKSRSRGQELVGSCSEVKFRSGEVLNVTGNSTCRSSEASRFNFKASLSA